MVGGGTGRMLGTTPVDAGAWLTSHGSPELDRACWVHGKLGTMCTCEASAALEPSATDLLVCDRLEPGRLSDRDVSFTRIYAVRGGQLLPVLDVPRATESPAEITPEAMAQSVSLDMSIEGETVTFTDNHDCPKVLASVDAEMAHGLGPGYFGNVRKAYAQVCAAVGRWRWNGTRFVRQSARP